MSNTWQHLARDLADRLDTVVPARLSGSLGIEPSAFRAELMDKGLAFHDPATGNLPQQQALERTAQKLIKKASRQAILSGAIGGMAGMAGVAPEIAWRLVQLLRLTQRLAIVYGIDPSTQKGELLIKKALAAGFEVDLPNQQGVGLRISNLPSVLRDVTPNMHQGASWLAQVAVRQTTSAVIKPIGRFVPGLAAGPAAWRARRSLQEQADRIHQVIRRAGDGPRWPSYDSIEAIEVP